VRAGLDERKGTQCIPGDETFVTELDEPVADMCGIKAVELIGHEGKVTWSRDEGSLTIKDLPAKAPGKHAFVFKFST
jgi:hypothetical protein